MKLLAIPALTNIVESIIDQIFLRQRLYINNISRYDQHNFLQIMMDAEHVYQQNNRNIRSYMRKQYPDIANPCGLFYIIEKQQEFFVWRTDFDRPAHNYYRHEFLPRVLRLYSREYTFEFCS